MKTDIPDKNRNYLTKKLTYQCEYFDSPDDYEKPVDSLKKEDFFSKLKNKCPSDEEIKSKKEIVKLFIIKNGEEITRLYLKSDVFLLACVIEKLIKLLIFEFGINPLYCVSLSSYTWQCGLIYTEINLQTLQGRDLILTLENNICGGTSSVVGDGNVKSHESKKILYTDGPKFYGHSMSQVLFYDEIEMWHGHRDLYMNKLEESLFTPDGSDIGYFIEVDLKYSHDIKEKT